MSVGVLAVRLACFLVAFALLGCASSPQGDAGQPARARSLADNVPARAAGEPANASKGPNAPFAYPSAFEVKQVSRAKLLDDQEYKNLRDDLVAARERANARAKATPSAPDEQKDTAVVARTPSAGEQLAASASN